MRIKMSVKDLKVAVSKMEKVLPARPSLVILNGILIDAKGTAGGVNLISTDLENTMRVTVKGEIQEEGQAVIPGKTFSGLVKQLDGDIEITAQKETAEVKSGDKNYGFNTYDPDEFPVFPTVKEAIKFTIPPQITLEGLNLTRPFINIDEPRPQFRGTLLDIKSGAITFVGTDTKSLSLYSSKGNINTKDVKVLLPVKAANILTAIMGDNSGPDILVNQNTIAFNFGDVCLVSQLLSGAEDFPEYMKVIPAVDKLKPVICKKDTLVSALRRVKIFASERYNRVSMKLAENKAELAVISPETGKAVETIEVEHTSPQTSIYFAIDNLLTGVLSIQCEELAMGYKDDKSPVLLTSAENSEEHKVVIMPLKKEG